MTGTVVFSLDFELGWGHADIRPEYVERLRDEADEKFTRIRALVDLFDEYGIPATWAVVGKLIEAGDDPLFHNPGIFDYLLDSQQQHDIGLHSYEHVLYSELTESGAQSDLQNGVRALEEWCVTPQSFVFPKNKVNHVELLIEFGFRSCRIQESLNGYKRLSQFLTPQTYPPIASSSDITKIPTSVFLAALHPKQYRRWYARRGLSKAIHRDEYVHYWLHPHNVITDQSLFTELEDLLDIVNQAELEGVIDVKTMSEIESTQ